ncbi:ATP-dependent RNA helicase DeaD [Streptomyces fumanus]
MNAKPPPTTGSFAALGLPAALLTTMTGLGIAEPFPVQAAALPAALAGRDVLARARTGSGKTLAFGLALLTRTAGVRAEPKRPLALVLVPTRELAQQVTDALEPYARALELRLATVVGGLSANRQTAALRAGAEVVVATPGRLADLVSRRDCHLDRVRVTVLDEADRMCRPRLPAAGGRPPRPGPPRRAAAALLGHPRRRRRPVGARPPARPGPGRRRPGGECGHHPGAPRPGRAPRRQVRDGDRDRRAGRPGADVPGHQGRRRPVHPSSAGRGDLRRRAAQRQVAAAAHPHPRPVPGGRDHRAGRHRRGGPRHPRRRPRPRRQRRPARRRQGLPPPRRTHQPAPGRPARWSPWSLPTSGATPTGQCPRPESARR